MSANPVLAEVVRGNWLENLHRGAFCVAKADGTIVASAGDIDRPIFPRSAIKSMQALAMFKSGAVEKYGLSGPDIAIACASHHGETGHVEAVAAAMKKIGTDASHLECGAHPPTNAAARKQIRAAGESPSAMHNNCSGKHTGMLGVAAALGVDAEDYVTREHAVQKLVRAGVEEVIGTGLTEDRCGTDGCSIPTWAAPLRNFAGGFARIATGEGLAPETARASKIIFDAATANPFLVGGTDVMDSVAMAAFDGDLMLKIGAEGVFCGAVRSKGLGFALKCDDGNMKAAEVMVAALISNIADLTTDQAKLMADRSRQIMKNWRGIEVATIGATDAIGKAFA